MTASRAKATWVVSVLWHAAWPRRRYGCTSPTTRPARVRSYLRGWAAVPASIRAMPEIPADTGAGHTLRWEGRRWVLRPGQGWRSWRWAPPPYVNRELGREERDAAAGWALEVLDVR